MIRFAIAAVMVTAALLGSSVAAASTLADGPGMHMLRTEDYAGAQAHFGAALGDNPRDAAAAPGMAMIELARDRNRSGVDWARNAVMFAPDDANYRMLLGLALSRYVREANIFRQLGIAHEVRDALAQAVRLEPGNAQARASLAKYYILAPGIAGDSLEKAGEQIAVLDQLDAARNDGIAQNPDNSINDYGLGQAAVAGDTELQQGMQGLRKFLELPHGWLPGTPTHKQAHVELGKLYALAGDAASAKAQYLAALDLDPDYAPAKAALASAAA